MASIFVYSPIDELSLAVYHVLKHQKKNPVNLFFNEAQTNTVIVVTNDRIFLTDDKSPMMDRFRKHIEEFVFLGMRIERIREGERIDGCEEYVKNDFILKKLVSIVPFATFNSEDEFKLKLIQHHAIEKISL